MERVSAVFDTDVQKLPESTSSAMRHSAIVAELCLTANASNETFWFRELIRRTISNAASRGLLHPSSQKEGRVGFRLGAATWLSSREYSRIAFLGIDQVCNFEV